jgi:hypothetical protein
MCTSRFPARSGGRRGWIVDTQVAIGGANGELRERPSSPSRRRSAWRTWQPTTSPCVFRRISDESLNLPISCRCFGAETPDNVSTDGGTDRYPARGDRRGERGQAAPIRIASQHAAAVVGNRFYQTSGKPRKCRDGGLRRQVRLVPDRSWPGKVHNAE